VTDRRTGYASERETLATETLRAHHLGLLRETVAICSDGPEPYRSKLEQAGITSDGVSDFAALARIPITTKAEAQAARAGLGTFPLHEAKRIFVSPGPHFYASQRRDDPPPQRGATPLALALHAMGFREGDIVLNTFAYHLSPGGFGLEDQLSAHGCAVVPAGPQNSEVQVQVLSNLPVTGYVGTPTFLRRLCDKAAELGSDPRANWSLEIAFVTAEKLTEDARDDLEARTGAMVRQVYGTADGLLPAYECWANSGMHLHPDQIIEVLDPETREPAMLGEVVATLPNPNRPLLRFATGDLVELRDDPCSCGRTGPRIARFAGRLDETAKVRGMFVYPEQIEQVLARAGATRWQAIVDAGPGGDDLRILVEGDVDAARAAADLKEAIRVRATVEPVAAGTIPEGAKRLDDRRSYA
jgi:phenylacetate-CoA ligase